MFRIGESSKLTQVSIRMLRYYDEAGLFSPAKIDRFTNYRLYSAEQIPDLNRIKFLRDLGFNVSEMVQTLDQWDDDFILEQLDKKRQEIEDAIRADQDKLQRIDLAKVNVRKETMTVHYNVAIKSVPGFQVFSLRRIVQDYYAEGDLWVEMAAYAKAHKIPISDQTFTIYHDAEARERDVDIEICAPVSQMGEDAGGFTFRRIEPVSIMAYSMVPGPFEKIADAFADLAYWLEENDQYQMSGQTRQLVHRGPWNEETPANYLTEIQIPMELRPSA
jgi:DNA-binding transcriptional MerR regulator